MNIFNHILTIFSYYTTTMCVCAVALSWRFEKRRFIWLKLPLILVLTVLNNQHIYEAIFGVIPGYFNVYFLNYVLAYVFGALILWSCFKINIFQAFFLQSMGYIFEHTLTSVRWLIISLADVSQRETWLLIVTIIMTGAASVLIYFTASKFIVKHIRRVYKPVLIAFAALNLIYTVIISDLLYRSDNLAPVILAFRLVFCFVLMTIPFLVFYSFSDRLEKQVLNTMLAQSEKQHVLIRESMDAINMRCHDLKHQIAALKTMAKKEDRNELVERLEKEIMIYDASADVGNDVLDVLLTEKNLACNKLGIDFTYNIDEKRIRFFDTVDLYTLLGNALDNAIEALQKVEQDRRVMSLTITGRERLTDICVENICESKLVFDGELPRTTKNDAEFHGYGLKSIRSIVEKYGGDMFIAANSGKFVLNMLFYNNGSTYEK